MCSSREAAVFFAEVFGPGLRHAAQGNIGKGFGYGREKSLIFCWNLRSFQRFAAVGNGGGQAGSLFEAGSRAAKPLECVKSKI